MKDKIKKFCKEHSFVVGTATGFIIADFLNYKRVQRLQAKGFMMVRPYGYDPSGMLHVEDIRGGLHHVHNHNK